MSSKTATGLQDVLRTGWSTVKTAQTVVARTLTRLRPFCMARRCTCAASSSAENGGSSSAAMAGNRVPARSMPSASSSSSAGVHRGPPPGASVTCHRTHFISGK